MTNLPLPQSAASVLPDLLPSKRSIWLDLSAANHELSAIDPRDTAALASYIDSTLALADAAVGLGGYGEHRAWYERSAVFRVGDEYRSIHLGLDLWCPAGTRIAAPLPGKVHSFADNAAFGDYGPTILIEHEPGALYSLFGHLSRSSLQHLKEGQPIDAGEVFATLGQALENGGWPPHLHWQLIHDPGEYRGDFPGVATPSTAADWLARCPDPGRLLPVSEHPYNTDEPKS